MTSSVDKSLELSPFPQVDCYYTQDETPKPQDDGLNFRRPPTEPLLSRTTGYGDHFTTASRIFQPLFQTLSWMFDNCIPTILHASQVSARFTISIATDCCFAAYCLEQALVTKGRRLLEGGEQPSQPMREGIELDPWLPSKLNASYASHGVFA